VALGQTECGSEGLTTDFEIRDDDGRSQVEVSFEPTTVVTSHCVSIYKKRKRKCIYIDRRLMAADAAG
jgi:hypothetical protein